MSRRSCIETCLPISPELPHGLGSPRLPTAADDGEFVTTPCHGKDVRQRGGLVAVSWMDSWCWKEPGPGPSGATGSPGGIRLHSSCKDRPPVPRESVDLPQIGDACCRSSAHSFPIPDLQRIPRLPSSDSLSTSTAIGQAVEFRPEILVHVVSSVLIPDEISRPPLPGNPDSIRMVSAL